VIGVRHRHTHPAQIDGSTLVDRQRILYALALEPMTDLEDADDLLRPRVARDGDGVADVVEVPMSDE
jgi:hypothetical protein